MASRVNDVTESAVSLFEESELVGAQVFVGTVWGPLHGWRRASLHLLKPSAAPPMVGLT